MEKSKIKTKMSIPKIMRIKSAPEISTTNWMLEKNGAKNGAHETLKKT